ncbi:hypothetical protein CBM2599_A120534 [Cupriavidus taiwanensis]|uniref:hypothetical protein n=1 Tax=Cupriavidus taiwanensis TaxID=164546 RepID=UPI000E149878|nr:hypothetical protein [Cupriavidus taiwanensis]SOY79969.1 hypothetical protein CBM2599_A120534 [Cupriavidus taiwanensis]SOY81938.1 hypothetical protein CBM2600_A120556 [Cupriavidus taiwanensis]
MTNLPQIHPQFLRHLSPETREEIARQLDEEPGPVFWFSLALVVLLAVFVVAYPIVMVLK